MVVRVYNQSARYRWRHLRLALPNQAPFLLIHPPGLESLNMSDG